MNKPTFKVIIAGGRDFNDYGLLREKCDKYLSSKLLYEVVFIADLCDQIQMLAYPVVVLLLVHKGWKVCRISPQQADVRGG